MHTRPRATRPVVIGLVLVAIGASSFVTASSALAQSNGSGSATAAVRPVKETHFGREIVDPYRWMEEVKAPETTAWLIAQDSQSRRFLHALPGRDALLARITTLTNGTATVNGVRQWGDWIYYMKQLPGEDVAKLYVREGAGGAERLLVNPELGVAKGTHVSIDYSYPSFDGSLVAYGSSPGGSENSEIRIVEAATGRVLPDRIERANFGGIAWRPDGKSFFYVQLPKLAADAAATERYRNVRTYLHTLGSDPQRDPVLLGPGIASHLPMGVDEAAFISTFPGNDNAFAVMTNGVRNELGLYVAPLSSALDSTTAWRRVVSVADSVTSLDVHGDALYLLTHRGAPRYRLIRTSIANPNVAAATVVVPAGEAVLQSVWATKDAVYVTELDGGIGRLRRVAFDGTGGERIPLPTDGTITLMSGNATHEGPVFGLTSWTVSPTIYRYDPASRRVRDMKLRQPYPADYSGIVAEEVKVRSADGTMIPLSIIHRRDLALDGSHPTLLDGYGAYGYSYDPNFSPGLLAWLEKGGVFAVAHVRGGGEYGEEWHAAGKGATKPNTWRDFIAAGEYLVSHRYTSPRHLAGTGTSAGGILIGRAITERPDLFGAAVIRVGDSDALRSETMDSGPANIPEFGTVADSAGFLALHAMDAYQHVKEGTPYPAVLLTTGMNDPRVAPWQAAKMAARLQAATTSGRPILLRVERDAGHGMGSTRTQRNEETADTYAFLFSMLRGMQP
jgi:prolyl oligopeptidase